MSSNFCLFDIALFIHFKKSMTNNDYTSVKCLKWLLPHGLRRKGRSLYYETSPKSFWLRNIKFLLSMHRGSQESDNSASWQLFRSYQHQAESQSVMNWIRASPSRRRERLENAHTCMPCRNAFRSRSFWLISGVSSEQANDHFDFSKEAKISLRWLPKLQIAY